MSGVPQSFNGPYLNIRERSIAVNGGFSEENYLLEYAGWTQRAPTMYKQMGVRAFSHEHNNSSKPRKAAAHQINTLIVNASPSLTHSLTHSLVML